MDVHKAVYQWLGAGSLLIQELHAAGSEAAGFAWQADFEKNGTLLVSLRMDTCSLSWLFCTKTEKSVLKEEK